MLDQEEQKSIEDRREAENTLSFIAGDPELSKKFSQLLQEAIDKQKGRHPIAKPLVSYA